MGIQSVYRSVGDRHRLLNWILVFAIAWSFGSIDTEARSILVPADDTTTQGTNNAASALIAIPDKPVNLSPAAGEKISSLTPQLQFSSFQSASTSTLKRIELKMMIEETSGSRRSISVASPSTTATTYLLQDYQPKPSTTYYWQIRYLDSSGSWSDYSDATSFTTPAAMSVIRVPQDSACIQAAADFALTTMHTEIIVSPGTYAGGSWSGKSIDLHSSNPEDWAIINSTIINWTISAGSDSRIAGFTFIKPASLICSGYNTTIECNRFTGLSWAAIQGCHGTIQRNLIAHCGSSQDQFRAISYCSGSIQNNIIIDNIRYHTIESSLISCCSGLIRNNTICNNYDSGTGRSVTLDKCTGTIENNILWGNRDSFGLNSIDTATCDAPAYCCIEGWSGGGLGNINLDPRFVNPAGGDYRLQADSPCLDAGRVTDGLPQDFSGAPRPRKALDPWRGDGGCFDLGAYEAAGAVLPDNLPPNPPVNNAPPDGTWVNTYTPPLISSDFSDPDPGQVAKASRWQISKDAGFTQLILDSQNTTTATTQFTIPLGTIGFGQKVYWRVMHQDPFGVWGPWSQPTSFNYPEAVTPLKPRNKLPLNGQALTFPGVGLTCYPYASTNGPPAEHVTSEWQVSTNANFNTSSGMVINFSTSNPFLVNLYSGQYEFVQGKICYWRVRHQNMLGFWSPWSDATFFTFVETPSGPAKGFPSIQAAIDKAASGDVIIVPPGLYREHLAITKDITLRSQNPDDPATVYSTVLDPGVDDYSVIVIGSKVSEKSAIKGFTIANGYQTSNGCGGGIAGGGSRALIEKNVFLYNSAGGSTTLEPDYGIGSGGALYDCQGIIQNNLFGYNGANLGGAIANCNGLIQNNVFYLNREVGYFIYDPIFTIRDHPGAGNTLYGCGGTIRNNLFISSGNDDDLYGCTGCIVNNIFWPLNASKVVMTNCTAPLYCCIRGWTGGGVGNIALDPQLADPGNGDFHLQPASPCIDSGRHEDGLTSDFENNRRGIRGADGPRGDGSLVDIGPYEFFSQNAIPAGQWVLYK